MVFSLLSTFRRELITYPITEGSTETFTEGFSEMGASKMKVVMVFRRKNGQELSRMKNCPAP